MEEKLDKFIKDNKDVLKDLSRNDVKRIFDYFVGGQKETMPLSLAHLNDSEFLALKKSIVLILKEMGDVTEKRKSLYESFVNMLTAGVVEKIKKYI